MEDSWPIVNDPDDGFGSSEDQDFFPNGGVRLLNKNGFYMVAGARFQNVTVPKNSYIRSARIVFVADTTDSNTPSPKATIAGFLEADTDEFSTFADIDSGRPLTGATVDWAPGAVVAGNEYNTAELKTLVQEIVNQDDWESGNAMGFRLKSIWQGSTNDGAGYDTRIFTAYEDDPGSAPVLEIEYDPQEVIIPSAVPLTKPKFTFIVESRDGSFRYATENWQFTEITREINGSMMVKIKTDQLTTDIANAVTDVMNTLTIRISTEHTGSQGLQYFSGYIPNRSLNLQADNQSVEITAFGFASRLFDIPYRTGTTVAIDKTAGITASNLAKDVIDKTIALDALWPVNYSASSIVDSVDTVKDILVLMKAGDVINKAAVLAYDAARIWHWVILGDNIFRFKKDSTSADHQFVYGREVLSFPTFSEDLQQAKNEVLVVYNGGANIKRVSDATSITKYGLRGDTVNETNIPDATTATELGNAYLASRIPPILAISITIGSNYPGGIENINPGDTCRIDNLPPDISNLLTNNLFITKTTYKRDTVDLELSIKSPFINNKIELIRRRLEQESVADSSATTYS